MYALPVSLHQVGPSHHGTYGLGKALTYCIQDVEYARMAAAHDYHQFTFVLQYKTDLILKIILLPPVFVPYHKTFRELLQSMMAEHPELNTVYLGAGDCLFL